MGSVAAHICMSIMYMYKDNMKYRSCNVMETTECCLVRSTAQPAKGLTHMEPINTIVVGSIHHFCSAIVVRNAPQLL